MKSMGKKSAQKALKNGVKNKIIAEREQAAPIGAAKIPAGRIKAAENQTRSSQASTKPVQVSAK
jgi:hypothetical protein